ncbi:MAG: YjgP/YjgQ family permease [Deltaproteobacteria bacterium]|jgi:lipopolysaccharide export system permease protein|nr:YjgP/YjgQ family permease [Deltaproteobacteria bacterium]
MKRINLYIAKEFFVFFGSCVFSLITIALTFVALAELDKIDTGGWSLFFQSILTGFPLLVEIVTPISILLATVLTYITLSKSSEIVAMMAAGVSLVQLLKPISACCIIISVFIYLNQSYLAPKLGSDTLMSIIQTTPNASKWRLYQDNLFYIYQAKKTNQTVEKAKIFKFDPKNHLKEILQIKKLTLQDGQWKSEFTSKIVFDDMDIDQKTFNQSEYSNDQFPVVFEKELINPKYAPFQEVITQILNKKRGGIDDSGDVFALCQKIALIISLFIMIILALPFSLFAGKSFNTRTGIVLAVILGFAYWLLDQIFMTLFRADILIAELAAFGANMVFLGIALILIYGRWS